MIGAHRRAVDDAQQHAPAGLDLDHLGIGERAVIGEERIVFHVVQIRLGGRSAHRHAGAIVRHSSCRRMQEFRRCAAAWTGMPPFLSSAKIWSGGVKLKSASITIDFLLVRPVALIADDQRRRHQELLLQPLMGMHPEGAAKAQREVVVGAAARRNRRSGDAGNAVLLPWRREAVPVDQARLLDLVFQAHAKWLADLGRDAERAVGLADAVAPRQACRSPRCCGARSATPSAEPARYSAARGRAWWRPKPQRRRRGTRGVKAWAKPPRARQASVGGEKRGYRLRALP